MDGQYCHRQANRMTIPDTVARQADEQGPWAVFLVFLRLGLTSFGGPVAHLG